MNDIVTLTPPDTDAELDQLAARYRAAGGVGVQVLNMVGGKAETLLDRLPEPVKSRLGEATEKALKMALRAALTSRSVVPDQADWINRAMSTAMGAAGGFGGLPSALVELPATTTVLLRIIQGVGAEHGFDPKAENVQFDCIRVFAAAGPLAMDDGADLGFLTLRITLTGGAMQKLVAAVAPRLATVLGQKLAAQTVPVLGAVAGATVNYVYSGYYREMAHVHFGLRRLAIDARVDHAELVLQLAERMRQPMAKT
ncbi:MAG: EcsC family protein [Rhodobacteraceae bacterium]|nr:EcsC family protein [Paracoccaceae bacterium]